MAEAGEIMDRRWGCGLATGIPPSFCLSRCFIEAQGTSSGDERICLSVTELAERMKWIWLGIGWAGPVKHLNISTKFHLKSRYTERDHLTRNRCPKQSCNMEWRQHRTLCKRWERIIHTQKPHGLIIIYSTVCNLDLCCFYCIILWSFLFGKVLHKYNFILFLLYTSLILSHLCVKALCVPPERFSADVPEHEILQYSPQSVHSVKHDLNFFFEWFSVFKCTVSFLSQSHWICAPSNDETTTYQHTGKNCLYEKVIFFFPLGHESKRAAYEKEKGKKKIWDL